MMRGGGETRHLAWARELRALGVDVDIIAGRPLVGRPRFPAPDRDVLTVRTPYLRDTVYALQSRRGFGRLTRAAAHLDDEWFCRAAWTRIAAMPRPPDVVHAHAVHQAARLRRGAVPVVIALPGRPADRYREDLAQADALVSDGWGAKHLGGLLGRPVADVAKGVDTGRFTPAGPEHRERLGLTGRRAVLCVSRLVPIKNVGLLLDAFATAAAGRDDVALVVVGEGPQRGALAARARALGIDRAVTFAGFVAHEELPAWYRSADVFALPSDFDNSPNVLLEAMASGLPVVATDVGGVSAYVQPGRNGALVARGAGQELATALRRYLDDPSRARAVGAQNRQDMERWFSWRASATALRDLYASVLAARGSRAAAGMTA
jgi:glycosyltransferase involved in cell wall biosynthesis